MAKPLLLLALLPLTAAAPPALSADVAVAPPPLGVLEVMPAESPPRLPQPCISQDPTQAFLCLRFEVDCASAGAPLAGDLALGAALGPPRGTLVFHGGGEGMHFWSGSSPAALAFATELRHLGFTVVQLRWDAPWALPPEGVEAGHVGTTCRGLTVVAWVHDHLHAPFHQARATLGGGEVGRCGFCVVGWSHGSVLMSYALAFYRLEDKLDAVVLESGPSRVDQTQGCLVEQSAIERHGTDATFGFRDGDGPCFRRDTAWVPRWDADSILPGGNDFVHPRTRVEFVFGTADQGPGPVGGARYAERLRDEGQPLLRVQVVPGAPHNIMATPAGVAAMRAAVLGS